MFCNGISQPKEVHSQIKSGFPKLPQDKITPHFYWDLVRLAAKERLFHHEPKTGLELADKLLKAATWLQNKLTIVNTASLDVLTFVAAQRLVELIRDKAALDGSRGTVHVGFAGGRTLRLLAEKTAQLLSEPHASNPKTLVFHAMVAGFDEDDFDLDPNSFINCFLNRESTIDIRLVRLPMPGIVSNDEYNKLIQMKSIRRVLDSAKDIQIVVTSGSLLSDQSSTTAAFFEHLAESSVSQTVVTKIQKSYEKAQVVGDLLWQPVGRNGPVEIGTEYRVATLMSLTELQEFMSTDPDRRVLLVLGRSGISGMPKSALLETLAKIQPKLFTDLVVDTPTLVGFNDPQTLEQYEQSTAPKA
ncbi:MAG: hypothetical protein AB7I48_15375 [Planctomycetaceae bacterium]